MLDLLIIMLERVGTIVAVAFILTRLQFFKNLIAYDKLGTRQELTAILFFGFFGIIGTYLGVALHTSSLDFNNVSVGLMEDEAIANMRVIGIVMAGLMGGYRIGVGAGLMAGLHRMTLGGFTSITCGVSTIIAGIISGACYRKGKRVKPMYVFAICASLETLQMLLILLFSKPYGKAFALVEVIGVPMILANGVGAALFMLIVHNVMSDREKVIAQQAQKTLRIADQTLAYLRKGINYETAKAVCEILYRELRPGAVALTNKSTILAHVGLGSDHHKMDMPIQTDATKKVIETGEMEIMKNAAIHCGEADCPFVAGIITPLKQRDDTIGTLKLYFSSEKQITDSSIELITGLSNLLGISWKLQRLNGLTSLQKTQRSKHCKHKSVRTFYLIL